MLAVVVLTWMIFWMRRQAHRIKGELQGSVDRAIAAGGDVRLAVMGGVPGPWPARAWRRPCS
ncbi:MAG TPA: FTR1 family protein [Actinomycetes bacterium]|nr:FTR1 family protein [Actinomycetes bacterium]